MHALLITLSFLGCSTPSEPQSPSPEPAPPPVDPAASPASTADPQALYDACGPAVEGPGEAGECSTDADCAAIGCSRELCVSQATAASGISTACIERPCHAVLDACGCVDGQCSWSLKDPS
jgi:eight-cysteine-cluster-containing protein